MITLFGVELSSNYGSCSSVELLGVQLHALLHSRGGDIKGAGGGLSPPTFKSKGAEPPQNNRLDGTIPRNLAVTYSYVTSVLGGWRL